MAGPDHVPPGGVAPGVTVPRGPLLPSRQRTWQALLGAAGLTFLAGLILLIWPSATLLVVAILVGLALLVTGILRLVQGITAGEESGAARTAYVVIGILAALAGLYCLRHIDATVAVLGFIVGLFWTVHGLVDLMVAATAPRGTGRGITAVTGVLSLAAGLLVMFWPSISVTILVAVLGAWLICDGLLLGFLAYQVRRAPELRLQA